MRHRIFELAPAIVSFVITIIIVFSDKGETALITFAFLTVIFWLFANVSNLSRFVELIKMPGGEIHLRKEIENSLNELKMLAAINAKAVFELVQTRNRLSKDVVKEQELYNEVTEVLKRIGTSQDEIKNIQQVWHYWIEIDYVRQLLIRFYPSLPQDLPTEGRERWSYLVHQYNLRKNLVTPAELRHTLQEFNILHPENEQWIQDYEHYLKHLMG